MRTDHIKNEGAYINMIRFMIKLTIIFAGLILNVLSPCLLEELIEDVGTSHFSLIVDGSTLIDTTKTLCMMIRYFSKKSRKVCTTFYRLIELESGTAEATTNSIVNQLKSDGLKLENLIGLGIDGENTMAGSKNSVSSKLKDLVPNLVVIKCLCHSLHLCAEKACDILPKNLDYLVKSSHSWFSNSAKRNKEYAEMFKVMNERAPKKIAKLSGTRWLARLNAIETILDQWETLRLHFDMARNNERGDVGYKAETLYQMYRDDRNKLYLLFLRHSLKKVIEVNKLFQSESAEPFKLLEDVNELFYSVLQNIVVPQQLSRHGRKDLCEFKFENHIMSTQCINFGYDFHQESAKHDPRVITDIKERCKLFLIKLAEEIRERIPKNICILEKLSIFSPKIASSQVKQDVTEVAVHFQSICLNVDETVRQWNMLHRLEFGNAETSDAYWSKVLDDCDAGGLPRFGNISQLAVALLSLPFSNAAVERGFSIVNVIKDKLRNKTSIKTADAIMRVRFLLKDGCTKFEPSPKMLQKFNSENVYQSDFVHEVLDVFEKLD